MRPRKNCTNSLRNNRLTKGAGRAWGEARSTSSLSWFGSVFRRLRSGVHERALTLLLLRRCAVFLRRQCGQLVTPDDDAVFGGLRVGRIRDQFQIFLHVQNGEFVVFLFPRKGS